MEIEKAALLDKTSAKHKFPRIGNLKFKPLFHLRTIWVKNKLPLSGITTL